MNEKIQLVHLERRAAVCLRQSTLKQVYEHRESTARQYALRQRAIDLGWPADKVDVIDNDLGQSGSSTERREGFRKLAEDVAAGRIGAIFALEVSRLARSSADWHQLLDLCGVADVVIADEQAYYAPRDYNDRRRRRTRKCFRQPDCLAAPTTLARAARKANHTCPQPGLVVARCSGWFRWHINRATDVGVRFKAPCRSSRSRRRWLVETTSGRS